MEFLGFDNSLIKNKFLEVFPKDKSDISLNNWNKFETNNPDIFIGMYKFWVRKIKLKKKEKKFLFKRKDKWL